MTLTLEYKLKMLYKSDIAIHMMLENIYKHLKKDYDYVLVVVGETGSGKSRFALNLFHSWYQYVLKKEVTPDMIDQINQNYGSWLQQFKKLKEYDMNVFDEGSRDLDSKDFNTRISKDLTKLMDVFRCKRFFSVVVLPKFFRLNKQLREDRVRGLVHVSKRGEYRFFTKEGLKWLNSYNERRYVKSMYAARPLWVSQFPDYKGCLLDEYLKKKEAGVDEVLDEVINSLAEKENKGKPLFEQIKDKAKVMKDEGLTIRDIAAELGVAKATVNKALWC